MPQAPNRIPPRPWARRPDGIVAVGGDLRPTRLLHAYAEGLFPWPDADGTLLWHSPDPRWVIDLSELRVPREVGRLYRQGRFRVTVDRAFDAVIDRAASARRKGSMNWISKDLVATWKALHRLGRAHSYEVWSKDQLVGGSYGLALGAAFFGESSFSEVSSAGAVGLLGSFLHMQASGFSFVDCQTPSSHLSRFGQRPWSRDNFLARLREARVRKVNPGPVPEPRAEAI